MLPALSVAKALETTRRHSVGGLTGARTVLVTARPYRAPPQTIAHVGLIGGGHVAHRLDHIEKRQRTGSGHGNNLLSKGFMGVRRQVRHDPWKEHTTCHHVDRTSPLLIS
jgi:hypothetical protein